MLEIICITRDDLREGEEYGRLRIWVNNKENVFSKSFAPRKEWDGEGVPPFGPAKEWLCDEVDFVADLPAHLYPEIETGDKEEIVLVDSKGKEKKEKFHELLITELISRIEKDELKLAFDYHDIYGHIDDKLVFSISWNSPCGNNSETYTGSVRYEEENISMKTKNVDKLVKILSIKEEEFNNR